MEEEDAKFVYMKEEVNDMEEAGIDCTAFYPSDYKKREMFRVKWVILKNEMCKYEDKKKKEKMEKRSANCDATRIITETNIYLFFD